MSMPDIYKYDYSSDPTNTGLAEKLWSHWGSTAATGVLTLAVANASNGDTITIDGKTYTFQTTLLDADGNVKISGVDSSGTLDNLIAAINLSSAVGTLTLLGSNASDGDTIAIDEKVYTLQATLTNVDGNVKIGGTSEITLDNLIAAINREAGAGTTYAALTTRQVSVYAVAGAGDTMDVVARRGGAPGVVATIESTSSVRFVWGAATLVGDAGALYSDSMTQHPSVTVAPGTGDTVDVTARRGGTSGNSIATTESTATVRFSWESGNLTGGVASLSSKFTAIDPTDSSGEGTGSFGFRLSPVEVTATWEANYRLEGTQASPDASYGGFAIDPGGRITDSSDPFPTASSQWSEERRCTYRDSGNTSDVIFILEWDHTFAILHESSNTNYFPYGCHVGKVLTSIFQSDIDLGLSGLGVLGHIPYWTTGSYTDAWISTTSTSKLQTATEAWDVGAYLWPTQTPSLSIIVGDRTEPAPMTVSRLGSGRYLGVLTYCYLWYPSDYAKGRMADSGGVARYMFLSATYVLGNNLISWDSTTVP